MDTLAIFLSSAAPSAGWLVNDQFVTDPQGHDSHMYLVASILKNPILYGLDKEQALDLKKTLETSSDADKYNAVVGWMLKHGHIRYRMRGDGAALFQVPDMRDETMRKIADFYLEQRMTAQKIIMDNHATGQTDVVFENPEQFMERYSIKRKIFTKMAAWAAGWLMRDGKPIIFPQDVGDHGMAVLKNPEAFGMSKEIADGMMQHQTWTLRYTAATNWMFDQGHTRFSIKGPFAFFEAPTVDDHYLRKIIDFVLEHNLKIDSVTVDGALDGQSKEFSLKDLFERVGIKTIDRYIKAQEEEQPEFEFRRPGLTTEQRARIVKFAKDAFDVADQFLHDLDAAETSKVFAIDSHVADAAAQDDVDLLFVGEDFDAVEAERNAQAIAHEFSSRSEYYMGEGKIPGQPNVIFSSSDPKQGQSALLLYEYGKGWAG